MAYTSIIPVHRLDRAVDYVMNKEKTTAVSLQDAIDYAANRDKTEQFYFESSFACTLESAFSDMRQTKERWHKLGGVQGYHLVQSFAAGEVTPELAHQIAKGLADRMLGGRYEYVIGTHLNTGHIHSHIVWNSVSRIDGKKYHSNGKSYVTQIRAVSDELCRKYKLSVIDTEKSKAAAKPYAEWLAEKSGQPTWRTAIRQDVDDAIQQSLLGGSFLLRWQSRAMKSAWAANIRCCALPVKNGLSASKLWVHTIPLKPFRLASYIRKLTARMSASYQLFNAAVCAAPLKLATS